MRSTMKRWLSLTTVRNDNGNNYCLALGSMCNIVWCNCNQLEIIMEAKLIAMNLTVIIISVILTLYVTL